MNQQTPVITFLPDDIKITAASHLSVLQMGTQARVRIPTRCNGVAGCLMCKVLVHQQGAMNPVTEVEKHKLGPLIDQGYRLACQCKAIANVTVTVPQDKLRSVVEAQLDQLRGQSEAEVSSAKEGEDWSDLDEWVIPEKYR